MSILSDIGGLLATRGVGTVGTTIFLGQLPPSPPVCLAILEYAGAPPLRSFSATLAAAVLEDARIQIIVRDPSYAAARNKAMDALNQLDWTVSYTSTSGVRYQLIEALQRPPIPLKIDESDRWIFTANYRVLKALST